MIRDGDAVAIAVDETQIKIDGETKWLYAAIDVGSKLLLEVDVYSRRGTDSAAGFLYRLTEKRKVANTEFLVDGMGYLTAPTRHDWSGQLDYTDETTSKIVSNAHHAHRPLSVLLAGQSPWRSSPASPIQTLLQPPSTAPDIRWPNSC